MILQTRRLTLRPVELADVPRFVRARRDWKVAGPGGMAPETAAAARRKIRAARADMRKRGRGPLAFSILLRGGGGWLGTISLRWPHAGLGELGYFLLPEFWGRGYATEAAKRVVDLAFRKFGAHRVQATTWVKNPASGRVLRKAGLRKEGRLRGYLRRADEVRDEFMFGITREDWRNASKTGGG